jgi:hypothetical protein
MLLALMPGTGLAQSLNYNEIFGSDWQKALAFVTENNDWMKHAGPGLQDPL